mgnify:CR=1 FL=1
MKNRLFVIYFCICFLALQLFAKEDKVSLQLLWLDQFQFAGYYIAKEKGFYQDVGLDVEIKKFKHNVNIVEEVTTNRAQYGVGRASLIVDKSEGKDIIALAAIFQSSPLTLLALESSKINNVKDFKNKKIMLTKDALRSTSLRAMVASQGVSFDELIVQKHSFDLNDLIMGNTDLMASYISNEPFTLKQKNIKYKIISPKDYGFDFYSDFLFTSSKEINRHPKRVESFLNASLKGWRYAFNNIEESVNIIFKKYNQQKKTKEALIFEAQALKKLAFQNTDQMGSITSKKLQRIYDIYKVMGLAKNKMNFNEFIYSQVKLNLNSEEKVFIKKHLKIKVHNDKSWPPYNFNENGLPKGFSIDYMNLIAKKLDLKIEYVSNKRWKDYLEMLKNKDLDIMLNIVNTPKRAKYINFTSEYGKNLPAIYTLRDRVDIHSLEDLKGKTVSVPEGFYTQGILEKYYPKINIKFTKDILEALKSVAFKNTDAAISDYAVANYLLQKNTINNVSAVSNIKDKRFERLLTIGVRKDLPILRNIIQKAIYNITDEELITLRRKWFGEEKKSLNKILHFSKKEKNYLQAMGDIKMCVDPDWAPYESLVDGKHTGMVEDYVKYFSKLINRSITLVPTKTWQESLDYIKNKRCDILPAAGMTIERLDYLNFTKPYMVSSFVIATTNDKEFIEDLKEIIEKHVGMVKGYSAINIFKNKYPQLKIKEYDNITKGLEAVGKGEIYGFIDTPATISHIINKNKLFELKIAGKLPQTWELGVGIRNDHPLLLSIFQKLISSLSTEEKNDIYQKWVSIKYEQGFNYDLFWKVILPIVSILIIIIFYLWNIKLKQEIRNRKKLEKKLKTSINDFKTLVNSTLEAIFIFDKHGYCIEANNEAIKLFGFKNSADILGKHMLYLGNEDFQKFSFDDEIQNNAIAYEASFKKNTGVSFPALVKGIHSSRGRKKIYITSIIDLSDLKEKEKLLFQQSKMALMGEMMSAIAHQWRQPLNAIAALNMTVETKLEFNDNSLTLQDYSPVSEKIQNQLNYMSKTIDDFRDFFIPSKRKVNFSIGKAIHNVYEMISPQLKSHNIQVTIDAQSIIINGYQNEFKQVLINIINNSKDAILSKKRKVGYIVIEVTALKEKSTLISISDNGGGIDEEIILKIFDPYFTTKFTSQGTGIGLYMSKMIIEKSMRGQLSVRNTKSGAIFEILI